MYFEFAALTIDDILNNVEKEQMGAQSSDNSQMTQRESVGFDEEQPIEIIHSECPEKPKDEQTSMG